MKDHLSESRKVIVFDLDGTLTKRDTYLPFLFGFLLRHPWRFLRALHLPIAVAMHLIGWRSNTWLKTVFLRACMGGVSRAALTAWINKFSAQVVSNELRTGALSQLQEYKNDDQVVLVLASASFDIYVDRIGQLLGFEYVIASEAEWGVDDCLTGELHSLNCYGEEKVKRIKTWLETVQHGSVDIAYSDHHSDMPLLQFASAGIAVNPTDKLRSFTTSSQIQIVAW